MGSTIYPQPSGAVSSVKSVQRGIAASAGSITISSVDMSKTICQSFPTGAAGTSAASGSVPVATVTGTGGDTSPFGYALSTAAYIAGVTSGTANAAVANYYAAYADGTYSNNYNGGVRYYLGGRYGNLLQSQNINAAGGYTVNYVQYTTINSYGSANASNANYSTAVNAAPTQTIAKPSQTISGGTTNIIAKEYGIYLSNATTIIATGPCRYEVVEYY